MAIKENTNTTKFGTFGGVFTPCTLTILGVIMFLRFGQVVGEAGMLHAFGIILVAKLITTLTTLSLSAIATNTRVRGGGAYYLISRSLGVEFGGAIGVLFFSAQAISVAMYIIGFSEALTASFPALNPYFTEVSTIVNLIVFICVYIGANWAIKVQYFILAILFASLVSFFSGTIQTFEYSTLLLNLQPNYSSGENIFTMFALFFPAVTGIMAGANMSGDLENPSRSIPTGTLYSVLVTTIIYLAMGVLLSGTQTSQELLSNDMIVRDVSLWPSLIIAGVFAATLSSALGSMIGAPRILQALAKDDIFSFLKFFQVGSGSSNEPRRATVLTYFVAQICIYLGDLNAIAPIITMFFMITYGLLNLATFYEAITKNPSYRPTFRYCHWSASALGMFGCFAVMFLINWLWASVSIIFIALLHRYIRYREIQSRWGDLHSGVAFEKARRSLLQLEEQVYHPKNWRPVIMALTGTGWERPHIPVYGNWLTSGKGILTLGQVVTVDIENYADKRDIYEKALRNFIQQHELQAFPVVCCNKDLSTGIEMLLQCYGIGSLKPNTVLLGWPKEAEKAEAFFTNIRLISRMNHSILALRSYSNIDDEEKDLSVDNYTEVRQGHIDIWWRGMENGELMLLLGHLVHCNQEWRNNTIRILRIVENEEAYNNVEEHLIELGASSRITIIPKVIVSKSPAISVIQEQSKNSSLVLLGFNPPEPGSEIETYNRMDQLAGNLATVLFVSSAGGMTLES